MIIEAKRIDNRELTTAMQDQLITRYLMPTGRRHGVYLTYWIIPTQRPANWTASSWSDAAELRQAMTDQAQSVTADGWVITPYVLDISRPE